MLKPTDVNFVIAHGNCPDGLGAAWSAWAMHGSNIEYYFATYGSGKDLPDVTGKNVLMVDFAYKTPEIMNELNFKANKMLLLDHHKSAKEALEGKIDCDHIFDMERSGARMSWDFFFPSLDVPDLISYIEDRDLWRWKLPKTREYLAALDSYGQNFETFDRVSQLKDKELESFISEGCAIVRYQQNMVKQTVKKAEEGILCAPNGEYPCFAVNCATRELISDVGNELANKGVVGLVWGYSNGQLYCSLRSVGDKFDVSEIASQFGGGGHRNASGFELKGNLKDIFKPA